MILPSEVRAAVEAAAVQRWQQQRLTLPAFLDHEVPLASEYSLEFCMWLQANFDRLIEGRRA